MHTAHEDLLMAVRHVTAGRCIVARQRDRIERLRALGCSTLIHEETLRVFLSTLQIFEEHVRELRENAEGAEGPDSTPKLLEGTG